MRILHANICTQLLIYFIFVCKQIFLGGERGGEAFGWTETYLFVCLIGKRPYILNLSPIKRKVREKWQFSLFGWGRGELKPPDGAETNFSVNYMYIGTHIQRIK